jgi:hypothetical protein
MKFNKNKSARTVAIGGVFLALSVVFLFLATIIPGIELTLFTLSSFFVAFMIIETSIQGGWIFYLASYLIAYIIIPNKGAIIPFAIFFGLYPVIKYYIESFKRIPFPIEIIIKLVLFNVIFGAGVILFKQLFLNAVQIPDVAFPIIIIGAQVFFLVYDYLLTLAVGFYLKKRPKG